MPLNAQKSPGHQSTKGIPDCSLIYLLRRERFPHLSHLICKAAETLRGDRTRGKILLQPQRTFHITSAFPQPASEIPSTNLPKVLLDRRRQNLGQDSRALVPHKDLDSASPTPASPGGVVEEGIIKQWKAMQRSLKNQRGAARKAAVNQTPRAASHRHSQSRLVNFLIVKHCRKFCCEVGANKNPKSHLAAASCSQSHDSHPTVLLCTKTRSLLLLTPIKIPLHSAFPWDTPSSSPTTFPPCPCPCCPPQGLSLDVPKGH